MIVSLWITIGLIIAAALVSSLGAYFSIIGIGALFSGALVAVCLMAGSLEFAKFVLAAYLHQTWKNINLAFRIYMTFAVITLSAITSIGVFGFLSDAYQSASTVLEGESIKLENVKKQQEMITAEIERLNYSVEEIPEERMSKRLAARQAIEPRILELNKKYADNENVIVASNLQILEVKKKVGPLIYISRNFNVPIDKVVQYLILVFVSVFDPLAICLVIASTYSLETRKNKHLVQHMQQMQEEALAAEMAAARQASAHKLAEAAAAAEKTTVASEAVAQAAVQQAEVVAQAAVQQAVDVVQAEAPQSVVETVKAEEAAPVVATENQVAEDDVIVQMNFKDEVVADNATTENSKVV
ncbi:hypothetical protein CIK05_05205 [Bdellovibrio sp. qaytius]|nr:hypothetical protein CIK05_05205 [Bdellovibrio sp. qaytius]